MDKDLHGILNKMGFTNDSRGIINRYIKVDGAWDPHLKNCRSFILDCVREKKYKNIAVYGSGWLLDLPLEELTEQCGHVWLYDLVHPRQILHKIKKYKNVTAVTADVSGVLKDAYEFVRTQADTPFRVTQANTPFSMINPDFAVSLNLLSQIGDLVTDYIARHILISEAEIDNINISLQESHLKLLMKQPSCLITDVREIWYDKHDKPCRTKQLVKCSLPVGVKTSEWQWDFDPLAEYNPGYITRSEVIALQLNTMA